MRSPKDFFRPLAVGAPDPVREIPVRPSRMIHFFPASNPKMVGQGARTWRAKVDVLLANLEDGVPGRRQGGRPGRAGRGRQGVGHARHPAVDPGQLASTRPGRSTTSPPP